MVVISWVGCKDDMELYGGFPEMGLPNNDGLNGKILLKWMIWGYPYFRKPPCCNASKGLALAKPALESILRVW